MIRDRDGDGILDGICTPVAFVRGDANIDRRIDLSDGVFILRYLFLSRQEPRCLQAADTDANGTIQMADAVLLFQSLFLGATVLASPFPGCESDPDSVLTCRRPSCRG